MNVLNPGPLSDLERFATTQEIRRQPQIWRSFAAEAEAIVRETRLWLDARRPSEIWLSGAGTSAFVGDALATYLNRAPGPARFRAVATTDLVSSPQDYLRPGARPLVVSFARSGDSPETRGVLDLLDAAAPAADRLNITCNADGALANRPHPGPGEGRVILLPAETNDSGFAMTSSFTTSLIIALLIFDRQARDVRATLTSLADAADQTIAAAFRTFSAMETPRRAVFLGSGSLTGASRECALKALELTAGRVAAFWNSPLGFRHGPKAIVDPDTKVFMLFSSDSHTRRYDADLADELERQFGTQAVVRLGEASIEPDLEIPGAIDDVYRVVLFVAAAQVLSVIWSWRFGLDVDNPFASGALTRVVAGVPLYSWSGAQPPVGAIDIGGTKIEACLFGGDFRPTAKRRWPTPRDGYEALLDAVTGAARWLESEAGPAIRIGMGIPGLVEPVTGRSTTSNLPATGRNLRSDLTARIGRPVAVENDCKLFALSEAALGAGAGYSTVFGLILGTGVGGGVCHEGLPARTLNGIAGEIGHIAVPAILLERRRLPAFVCGCGRTGCYEAYASGPGLVRMAEALTGASADAHEIARGEGAFGPVRDAWIDLIAELLYTIQLTVDPECVVLGGGLSNTPGLAEQLSAALKSRALGGVRIPRIAPAEFGDSSGVRGAALLAVLMGEAA